LQASRNAHPPQADCAFESACALPSGVIRDCETTSSFEDVLGLGVIVIVFLDFFKPLICLIV
jgi:hypothetical protein